MGPGGSLNSQDLYKLFSIEWKYIDLELDMVDFVNMIEI